MFGGGGDGDDDDGDEVFFRASGQLPTEILGGLRRELQKGCG